MGPGAEGGEVLVALWSAVSCGGQASPPGRERPGSRHLAAPASVCPLVAGGPRKPWLLARAPPPHTDPHQEALYMEPPEWPPLCPGWPAEPPTTQALSKARQLVSEQHP